MIDFLRLLDDAPVADFPLITDQLRSYFAGCDKEDIVPSSELLLGHLPQKVLSIQKLKSHVLEFSGIKPWLFDESYAASGNLLETISLLPGEPAHPVNLPLNKLIYTVYPEIVRKLHAGSTNALYTFWRMHRAKERLVLNELLCGKFKSPFPAGTVITALASHYNTDAFTLAVDIYTRLSSVLAPLDFSISLTPVNSVHTITIPKELDTPPEDTPALHPLSMEVPHGIASCIIITHKNILTFSADLELLKISPPLYEELRRFPSPVILEGLLANTSNTGNEYGTLYLYGIYQYGSQINTIRGYTFTFQPHFIIIPKTDDTAPQAEIIQNPAGKIIIRQNPGALKTEEILFVKGDSRTMKAVLLYAETIGGGIQNRFKSYTFGILRDDIYIPVAKIAEPADAQLTEKLNRYIRENTTEKFGPVRSVKPGFEILLRYDTKIPAPRTKYGYKLVNVGVESITD